MPLHPGRTHPFQVRPAKNRDRALLYDCALVSAIARASALATHQWSLRKLTRLHCVRHVCHTAVPPAGLLAQMLRRWTSERFFLHAAAWWKRFSKWAVFIRAMPAATNAPGRTIAPSTIDSIALIERP